MKTTKVISKKEKNIAFFLISLLYTLVCLVAVNLAQSSEEEVCQTLVKVCHQYDAQIQKYEKDFEQKNLVVSVYGHHQKIYQQNEVESFLCSLNDSMRSKSYLLSKFALRDGLLTMFYKHDDIYALI